MSKARTITLSKLGEFGYAPDALNGEPPIGVMDVMSNIMARDGALVVTYGAGQVENVSASTIDLFVTKTSDNKLHILTFTPTAAVDVSIPDAGSQATTTVTRLSGAYTGSFLDVWTGGFFNGVGVFTNGVDLPQQWLPVAAGTRLLDLQYWPVTATAKIIRSFKSYLIALDVTKASVRYPWRIKWSAASDVGTIPPTWDETDAQYDAGEYDVAAMRGFLKDLVPLGDRAIIYSENSVWAMSYVGGQSVFSFELLFDDFGALNTNCVVEVEGSHFVVTNNDIILHNGTTKKSIADARVREAFFGNLDQVYGRTRTFVLKNEAENEIWVLPADDYSAYSPTGYAMFSAYVWNYRHNTWYLKYSDAYVMAGASAPMHNYSGLISPGDGVALSYTASAKLITANWARTAALTKLHAWGYPFPYAPSISGTTGSTALQVEATRKNLTFLNYDGSPNLVDAKTALELRLHVEGSAGATFTVHFGTQTYLNSAITYTTLGVWTVGTTTKMFIPCITGNLFALRFINSAQALPWKLRNAEIDVVMNGITR